MRARISKKSAMLYRLAVITLIALTALVLIDSGVRPIVRSVATYEARVVATNFINETINEILTGADIDTKSLVKLNYDSAGEISTVQTDVTAINRLQAELSLGINEKISQPLDRYVEIPLGTLTGLMFLNGRGKAMRFKLLPLGYIKTSLSSEFSEAGINQTHHKILLTVSATFTTLIPGNRTEFELPVSYILADTILVGQIPNSFTYVTGDNRENLSKVNDYK